MNKTTAFPSRLFPLLAIVIASGMTAYVWHRSRNVPPPAPLTALDITVGVANHVLYGGGCPSSGLNLETMSCAYNGRAIDMTLTCKTTGAVLSTDMVKGIPGDEKQFRSIAVCGESSVIAWTPTGFVFGVRNLKIDLMSRDPNQITNLMCRASAAGMAGADYGQTPEALTLRPDEIGTPSPTTGPK